MRLKRLKSSLVKKKIAYQTKLHWKTLKQNCHFIVSSQKIGESVSLEIEFSIYNMFFFLFFNFSWK